jgi:hypothetical protein
MSKKVDHEDENPMIQIALTAKHWVVLLAILNQTISNKIAPAVQKLRERGTTPDDVITTLKELDDAQTTALAGPLIIQGIIVKELVARGIMTPDADEKIGIDRLMNFAEEFRALQTSLVRWDHESEKKHR